MIPPSLEALVAVGDTSPDRHLAARHLPLWLLDRNEPYQPLVAGYTVFHGAGRSPSSKFEIAPKSATVIEYAVWYDWDIGHLYDLEHVWVHLDTAGTVVGVEASAHGRREITDIGNGLSELRDGRPIVVSEPGKHAHWALASQIDDRNKQRLVAHCSALAGIEGVHLGNSFAAAGAYTASPFDHRLARLQMQHDGFRPSFRFVPAKAEAHLVPWAALESWIPRRVAALVADLPKTVPHFPAIALDPDMADGDVPMDLVANGHAIVSMDEPHSASSLIVTRKADGIAVTAIGVEYRIAELSQLPRLVERLELLLPFRPVTAEI